MTRSEPDLRAEMERWQSRRDEIRARCNAHVTGADLMDIKEASIVISTFAFALGESDAIENWRKR